MNQKSKEKTMKTRKFLWAVLPMMAAALALTSCSSDDTADKQTLPGNPADKTEKVIPYTVTVKGDAATTRATVDGLTMKFAAGDKLYVQNAGGDIHGVLSLTAGDGGDNATFSGDLHYASAAPTSSTELTATLVSATDELATISDGKVTGFTYPTENNVCTSLADAVARFSKLQGTANYGSEFTLTQSTAFLKFAVTLEDGTVTGTEVPVVIKDGETTIGTGTTTTTGTKQFIDIVANFVLPVADGTSISTAAKMCVANVGTDDESIDFGGTSAKTLAGGKVYNIAKTKNFVRMWAGGPVWASRNVSHERGTYWDGFANSVDDYGSYYCWGGTTDVNSTNIFLEFNENSPFWVSGSLYGGPIVKLSKYILSTKPEHWGGSGTPDNKTTLDPVDDAATANLGSPWRMPTKVEFNSMLTNCQPSYGATTINSCQGKVYNGKGDYSGKALFLPIAGYRFNSSLSNKNTDAEYWSSSLHESSTLNAYNFYVQKNSGNGQVKFNERCYGYSVRAVHD